ncbi:MAG: aromatic amino acid transaminase [Castellaniella sp.]|uniref:amino acid aminotransferase n=1 Tax=Castellaniella sp. TaxID=1955812 RepID=UPI003A8AC117
MSSIFASVELAPRDPILGLNEQFKADTRPTKVNLGVGVYYDDAGRIPLLKAVRQAETRLFEQAEPRNYLPIDGIPGYNTGACALLLGADSPLIAEHRSLTVQTLGGTGALKVGADFLKRVLPDAQVAISNPSWANHQALFTDAGFRVVSYDYYDAATHGLNFEGMLASLRTLPAGTIVVLHACCHNPTGVDPSPEQWREIARTLQAGQLVPFLDIAYQGFGSGTEEDAFVVRLFAELGMTMFISSSFSKSFSLYGERVGALTLVTSDDEEGTRVLSQLKRLIRTNYSNPPTHGGALVSTVLNTPELYVQWIDELAGMRDRIRAMRHQLVEKIQAQGVDQDFSFVKTQRGMFSYSGLTKAQVDRLREDFGIYAVGSGRICVAAINSGNIDYVAQSIARVI